MDPAVGILALGALDAVFWRSVDRGDTPGAVALSAASLWIVLSLRMPAADMNTAWNMASIVFTYALLDPGVFSSPRRAAGVACALLALYLVGGSKSKVLGFS